MIHCCPKRIWYVEEYLIPSMLRQGIDRENIIVWKNNKNGFFRSMEETVFSTIYFTC